MIFGYSVLDPLVVAGFTVLTFYYLDRRPVRLLAWLPASMSAYFFIPFITLLTVGQVVSLILSARMMMRPRMRISGRVGVIIVVLLACLIGSCMIAAANSPDLSRLATRALFYVGLLATFLFAYETGRSIGGYEAFVKGAVCLGIVFAAYALYQLVAFNTGLPLRGIVRGTSGAQMAFEGGLLRVNSLASEPKRLGFVLLVCGLACFEWGRINPVSIAWTRIAGVGILMTSMLTFAGSYIFALLFFAPIAILLYPRRMLKYVIVLCIGIAAVAWTVPESGLIEAMSSGFDRRLEEVEIGLDGQVVYRQELFALDYMANNPFVVLGGVGLGQYYQALWSAYGPGVGISVDGANIIPMNSAVFEALLDAGGTFVAVIYASLIGVCIKLRRNNQRYLCISLVFLLVQSFSIQTLPFVAIWGGVGLGRVAGYQDVGRFHR